MSNTIGSIKIKIGGDIRSLEKSLSRAERRLQRSGRKLAELGSRLSAAITLPVLGIGASALKVAGDFGSLKMGMESMMGSAEAAKKEIALLRKEALKPGLNFEQALKGSTRLQAVGVDAGVARRALAGFGNALALVGGTGAQLDGVTLALTQIAAKGKISAEEINQLAERVPQIRQILKDAFGTADTEELQKLGIGFEEFVTKSIIELEKLPKAQSGIKNSIENTQLALQEAAAIIGAKVFPIFEEVSKVVLKLTSAFSRLPDGVQDNIVKFSLLAAITGPLVYAYGTLKIAMGGLVGTLGGLVGGFGRLFVIQKGGIAVGKVLSASLKSLALATSLLSGTLNIASNGSSVLMSSLSRLGMIFHAVSIQGQFLAGAVIRQLGRSFLFLTAPMRSLNFGLLQLGRSLVGYGNGLMITSVLNNRSKLSFDKLIASVKLMGTKIAFVAKNPLKALRAGLIAIGGVLSGITIPFGLVAAAIAGFGVAVIANIGPARKKFVELANDFIDLYNESQVFRGAVEGIAFAFKGLFSVAKAVLSGIWAGIKGIGNGIKAAFLGDVKGIKKALLDGFGGMKEAGNKAGEELANNFNKAYKNTVEEREGVEHITEEDVDKTINKAAEMIKNIQDKFFGSGVSEEITTTAFDDLLKKIFGRTPKKGKSSNKTSKSDDFDKNAAIFNQLTHSETSSLGSTSLLPEGLQEHLEKISTLSDKYKELRETLTPLQSVFVEIGNAISNSLENGAKSFKEFARTALSAIGDVIAAQIKLGVTKAITNAIGKAGPFGLALAGIAGGIAAGLFKTALGKISVPKLAKGGLAFGETMVTIGDNPNAIVDPEVVAPLSKLNDFLKPAVSEPQVHIADVRIQGSDLILMFNRATQQGLRVNHF